MAAGHWKLVIRAIVRPLMARWGVALVSCLMSAAVREAGRSLPPSVTASFGCVRITDAGWTRRCCPLFITIDCQKPTGHLIVPKRNPILLASAHDGATL